MPDETCKELDCCVNPILTFRAQTSFELLAENSTGAGVPTDGYILLTEDNLDIKT